MATVSIISVGTELQLVWTVPNDGGDSITEYELELFIAGT